MKQGRSITELAQEIERQANEKRDFIAPSSSLRIQTDSEKKQSALTISMNGEGSEQFLVNPWFHTQVAQQWKVPQKYYERLLADHPDLLDWTVNTLMNREPKNRMVRVLDGRARALQSDRYRPLDNYDLANASLPVLAEVPEMSILSCEITEYRMYIKALFPRIQKEVKVGDVVQSGVVISNSEVGKGSVRVEPLVYRPWCKNGMVSAHALKRHHVGRQADAEGYGYEIYRDETKEADDKAFWMKVQDTVRASVDEAKFADIVARLAESTEKEIKVSPVKAVEVAKKSLGLNESEGDDVLKHLIQGGDLTQWGLANAITRTAQDVESYDRATDLERLGGNVIELPRKDWEQIALKAA